MRRIVLMAMLVAVMAAPLACRGSRPDAQGEASAPDFVYITDEQLESAMWRLAAGIRSLQAIFGETPVKQSQRPEVIRILDEMIVAAEELGPEGVASNHSRITHNLGRFREKLEIARSSVEMNPPRYYLVGNLSGTCLACHKSD
jgi:hypothetical protein